MKTQEKEIHVTAQQVNRDEAERGAAAPRKIPGEENDDISEEEEEELDENDLAEDDTDDEENETDN